MKLEMRGQMRMEQRMKLAPHMIQSMEILQLSILALQERIEQELNSNPVLEMTEPSNPEEDDSNEQPQDDIDDKDLIVSKDNNKAEDFERLENLSDSFKDYLNESGPYRKRVSSDDPDKKLEAIKNTAARPQSLHEYLTEQWGLVEAEAAVKKAGDMIIDYIDSRGYLSVRLEQLHNKDKGDFTIDDLNEALELVQKLDPTGVGARDLRECLLIQMSQSGEDMSFESRLIADHMKELLENKLPDIAKKMNCGIDAINRAIVRLSKLDMSPGMQIGRDQNHPITPDVIVELLDNSDQYSVRLADFNLPRLRVNDYYAKMAKDIKTADKTKKFLQNNLRSAQWIIDAIEQRKSTLLKVTKAIVRFQMDFFEKGQLYLRPLPMSKIADDVGVHLATISRAVAGKYVQCSWGILPLRKFFSGGTEDVHGTSLSWGAIRAKLQQIIDSEDKSKPLNDEQIREKLSELGITNLARRTVAKYRKLLNIPAARFRKKY
ncbi:MAG: RNA polymerase factor sigma-54 [Planctomycetes bacterium]|nr:RNA polymerase factor sigma-54 [Planctomycetota bacterium]MBL7142971.1 RNA polymerase factor sigma-54 [Phycisphaerae bacterium]